MLGSLSRKSLLKVAIFLLILFLAAFVAQIFPVNAQNNRSATAAREQAQQRRDEASQRTCERIVRNIRNRSIKLGERAEKMMDRFDRIVRRVNEFYQNRLEPQGVVIANYDQMLDNIDTKKDAVKDAIVDAKAAYEEISCDSGEPRSLVGAFGEAMKKVITALHDYRRAVIDYLKTVRMAAAEAKSATNSATRSAN
jgi:hypothetical protein